MTDEFFNGVKAHLEKIIKPEYRDKISLSRVPHVEGQPEELEFDLIGEIHGSVREDILPNENPQAYAAALWMSYAQRILMTATAKAEPA